MEIEFETLIVCVCQTISDLLSTEKAHDIRLTWHARSSLSKSSLYIIIYSHTRVTNQVMRLSGEVPARLMIAIPFISTKPLVRPITASQHTYRCLPRGITRSRDQRSPAKSNTCMTTEHARCSACGGLRFNPLLQCTGGKRKNANSSS